MKDEIKIIASQLIELAAKLTYLTAKLEKLASRSPRKGDAPDAN